MIIITNNNNILLKKCTSKTVCTKCGNSKYLKTDQTMCLDNC